MCHSSHCHLFKWCDSTYHAVYSTSCFGFNKQQPQVIMGNAVINTLKQCPYLHIPRWSLQLHVWKLVQTVSERYWKIWMLYYCFKSLIICIMSVRNVSLQATVHSFIINGSHLLCISMHLKSSVKVYALPSHVFNCFHMTLKGKGMTVYFLSGL